MWIIAFDAVALKVHYTIDTYSLHTRLHSYTYLVLPNSLGIFKLGFHLRYELRR